MTAVDLVCAVRDHDWRQQGQIELPGGRKRWRLCCARCGARSIG